MKKFTFSFKSLLLAAGLLLGSANAWADLTPFSESYSSTSTTTGWSTATSGRYTPAILNEGDNYFLSVNQGQRHNNGTTVTGSILSGKAEAGDDFTLIFDFRISTSNNQTPVEFYILDADNKDRIFSLENKGTYSADWKINGSSTTVTLSGTGSTDNTDPSTSTIGNYSWFSAKITRTGALTYLTITKKSDATVVFERSIVTSLSSTGGLGNMKFVTKRYNSNFAIDNIVLRAIEAGDVPAASPTTYTIHFKNESSATIKDDVVVNTLVGSTVNADDYLTAIYTGGKKYIYKSGNTPIEAVEDAASNVITLVFREADTWTYTLNAVDSEDDVIAEVVSGTQFEGDNKQAYFPKAFKKGDVWYQTTSGASGATYYGFNISSAAPTESVLYTETDGIDYFFECEEMTVVNKRDDGSSAERGSNGAGLRLSNNGYIYTTALAAGTYTLRMNCNNPNSGTPTFDIKLWDGEKLIETGKTITKTVAKTADFAEETTTGIAVLEGMCLAICNFTGYNANPTLDYIILKRTGEPSVSATIGTTGYTTFASPYALNLSGMTASTGTVTAFYASASDASSVTMTSTTATVAAGEGLLLKGSVGATITIPVVASGDAISGNKLKGCTTSTALSANANYWVLVNNGGTAEFQNLAENGATIPEGKAYLDTADPGVKALGIVFAGDTATGVEAPVAAEAVEDGIYYNLNGQQVTKDYKGIVIVNGKKFYNK